MGHLEAKPAWYVIIPSFLLQTKRWTHKEEMGHGFLRRSSAGVNVNVANYVLKEKHSSYIHRIGSLVQMYAV